MIDSTNVIKEEERNSAEMLIVIMVLEFYFDIFVVIFVKNIISTPPQKTLQGIPGSKYIVSNNRMSLIYHNSSASHAIKCESILLLNMKKLSAYPPLRHPHGVNTLVPNNISSHFLSFPMFFQAIPVFFHTIVCQVKKNRVRSKKKKVFFK